MLGSQSFDWLSEQGHVGLERVAKARREPALAGPVTAVLEPLGTIYARLGGDVSVLHASRENLLLPVELVHEQTGTVIEVDESHHFTSFRLAALELYPVAAAVGFDLDEHRELCRALVRADRRPRPRPGGQGLRLRRDPAGAGLPRRAARPRRTRDGPSAASFGSPPSTATGRRHTAATGSHSWRFGPSDGGLVPVDDGHVDRRAASAADADLLRHLLRVHRRGEQIAALDADVVVRAVAVEDGPVRVLLDRRAAVARHLAGADLSHRDRRHRRVRARRACRRSP